MEFVPLAHFANSAEAEMALEMMHNNGIRAVLSGEYFGALDPLPLPGGFSEITMLVASADFGTAREIYDAYFGRDSSDYEIDSLPPDSQADSQDENPDGREDE